MSQSRQCGLQGNQPCSTTKKKIKKKMCPDENDGVGFEINHPHCNPFSSQKDFYDNNNEHVVKHEIKKDCNITSKLCDYFVVSGSKTPVFDLVQTKEGDSFNSNDRNQQAGEVLENFHYTVNPPYERYETNHHDDNVSVFFWVYSRVVECNYWLSSKK